MEFDHGPAATSLFPDDPRCLCQLWRRWFRGHKTRKEAVLVDWMCVVHGLEHHHDDDRGYPHALWRPVLEWIGKWLLYDILAALYTGE